MKLILLLCLLLPASVYCQTDSFTVFSENQHFRELLNEEYHNPKTSPLKPVEASAFKGHDFYPVQLKYRVIAKLTLTDKDPVFKMRTSSPKKKDYRRYGIATFSLDGKQYQLNIYQSMDLMKQEAYKDFLFLPFGDQTNGSETYGGGRYIELRIPKAGEELIIDFNQAYNPYCAYSDQYSCPLIPRENILEIPIFAGVKLKE